MRFLVRGILGLFAVLCVNYILSYNGIMLTVGLNPITFLTTGTLGFPGVALLYGVVALQIL